MKDQIKLTFYVIVLTYNVTILMFSYYKKCFIAYSGGFKWWI